MTTANLKRKLRLPKCESYKAANATCCGTYDSILFAQRLQGARLLWGMGDLFYSAPQNFVVWVWGFFLRARVS